MQFPGIVLDVFQKIIKVALTKTKEDAVGKPASMRKEQSLQFPPYLVEDDEFHGISGVSIGPGDEFPVDDVEIIKAWSFIRKVYPLFENTPLCP